MKNLFKAGVLLALIAAVFVGCSDDEGYSLGQYRVTYGTVEENDKALWIRLDNGELITAVASLVSYSELKSDDRLSVNYTIMGEDTQDERYYVRINNYVKCQSKRVMSMSEVDEEQYMALGYDLIKVEDVWFGGKYLNVIYSYLQEKESKVEHLISLVYNDWNNEDKFRSITLLHNAHGDTPSLETIKSENKVYVYSSNKLVSFDILSMVPKEMQSIDVKLQWREYGEKEWYNGVDREKSGAFIPYGHNMTVRMDGETSSMSN